MKALIIWAVIIFFGIILFSGNKPASNLNSTSAYPEDNPTLQPIDDIQRDAVVENSDNTQTFKGYTCTGDCSGHEAGYNWAEEKGIESIDDCGGNSDSFIEGCQSYVEENFPEDTEE